MLPLPISIELHKVIIFSDNIEMSEFDTSSRRSRRLSGEPVLDEDCHFPMLSKLNPPDKLPTVASIVRRLRMLYGGGKRNMTR